MSVTFHVIDRNILQSKWHGWYPYMGIEPSSVHTYPLSEYPTIRAMLEHLEEHGDPSREKDDVKRATIPLFIDGCEPYRALADLICSPASLLDVSTIHLPAGLPPIWVCMHVRTDVTMTFFIKTLTGKTAKLTVTDATTYLQMKEQLQDKEGIPPEQQRYVYAGKQMMSRLHTFPMMTFGLGDCSTIHLVLRLRGGATHTLFADMSVQPQQRGVSQASEHTPSWMCISSGLNVEVVCRGAKLEGRRLCRAAGITSYVKKRFGDPWVLGVEAPQTECPACSGPAHVTGCGFFNCEWRWFARKSGGTVDVSSPWTGTKKGQYAQFTSDDSDGGKFALYEALLIMVRPLELPDEKDHPWT